MKSEEEKAVAREYAAKYRASHRTELAEKQKVYAADKKEVIAAYQKAYRAAHKEEMLERQREYFKKHPEKYKEQGSKRRARELNAEGTHTAADIKAIYEKQEGNCYWCGKHVGKEYHVDHFMPLSKGGTNWPDNLVIACPQCNLSKGAKLPDEWMD